MSRGAMEAVMHEVVKRAKARDVKVAEEIGLAKSELEAVVTGLVESRKPPTRDTLWEDVPRMTIARLVELLSWLKNLGVVEERDGKFKLLV